MSAIEMLADAPTPLKAADFAALAQLAPAFLDRTWGRDRGVRASPPPADRRPVRRRP